MFYNPNFLLYIIYTVGLALFFVLLRRGKSGARTNASRRHDSNSISRQQHGHAQSVTPTKNVYELNRQVNEPENTEMRHKKRVQSTGNNNADSTSKIGTPCVHV